MTLLSLFTFMHWRRKWRPSPVFLPGEPQGAWWAAVYGVAQSQTWLKRLSSSSSNRLVTGGFPVGSVVKNLPANTGDMGSIPGLGRSPGEVNGNPLQYPCLENIMDRGAWWLIASTIWTFVGKVMSLLFNTLSWFVIAFLPRSKCLLISWLQSPSAVILQLQKIKSLTVSIVSHLFAMK